ncbi:MAG TPA: hypothetical protein DEF06_09340 [Clostridiales bacterium]|nr:hypothetical protein [Clostridiales bacterium]
MPRLRDRRRDSRSKKRSVRIRKTRKGGRLQGSGLPFSFGQHFIPDR